MHKKVGLGLLVVVIIGALVALYYNFKPTTSTTSTNTLISETITYDNVSTYISDTSGSYVLVVTDNEKDSRYLKDTLLVTLSLSHDTNPLPKLIGVDMSQSQNVSVTRLEKVLGTKTYPALVFVKDNVIVNSFTFKDDNYLEEDVKTWFFENDLWNAPYIVSDTEN